MPKKRLALLLSAVLILLIPFGVFAAKTLLRPRAAAGGYYRDLVDRVEISADHTEFTFQKTTEGAQTLQAELSLTLKKTEADFFAQLDSLDVVGAEALSVEFLCETPGLADVFPQETALPVLDGESVPLRYRVLMTFSADAPVTLTPSLEIGFTSGLTAETADGRLLRIPLHMIVE